MTITNSTIVEIAADSFRCNLPFATLAIGEPHGAGGIHNFGGRLKVQNSTVARNFLSAGDIFRTVGIINQAGGTVELQNTIIALNNNGYRAADCAGVLISVGNNLIGDTSDCDVVPLASDFTGDLGLGVFTDTGKPEKGHIPRLSTSQAIILVTTIHALKRTKPTTGVEVPAILEQ